MTASLSPFITGAIIGSAIGVFSTTLLYILFGRTIEADTDDE